ncbi:acyl-CoA carboxylase subunit beta [Actinophytocola xanthii]|uniref:Propionyl-CoA carboxylase subunit beta n=1 Tax=Actinophytocola xanthii TaxID=1912961 RepID=A0A1Q8CPE4_9PSEU|nr:carboxyl transferase domain-containing protein [Actinophytocola xanthii]OLF16211.1 propionyl-CoA carboxylase subunit beta [Actinophytocola xanthii]
MTVATTSTTDPRHAERDYRDPTHRMSQLLDTGSLQLVDARPGLGVAVARGRVEGRPVIVYCTDGSRMGGAIGVDECPVIVDAIDAAVRDRCPVIGVWHSGGAKLAEGVRAMDGIGRMFAAMVRASGRVPQLSLVLGPAAGGAAYGPALTDLVVMSEAGRVFVTGPEVVRSVTGEQVDMAGLGGPEAHSRKSGVVHVSADSEAEAFARTRELVTLLDRPGRFDLDRLRTPVPLRRLLPESARRAYDVRPLVRAILDEDAPGFLELQPKWAPNVVVGLGRLGGGTLGVIANNPLRKGGCLDSLAAEKAARFVRMCDSFGIPLLVLVDVPGYLPGTGQEWNGVVRRGAKLLHAFAEATVPRVTLVTRKSYGGAYIAMNSRSLGATAVLAWPESEVAVMGAGAAVDILHRKRLAATPEAERPALRAALVAEHELVAGGVAMAMEIGVVDEVIDPTVTRLRLGEVLAAAPAHRGQHGNIPL